MSECMAVHRYYRLSEKGRTVLGDFQAFVKLGAKHMRCLLMCVKL